MDSIFNQIGVHRFEADQPLRSRRGDGVLTLQAAQEGIPRESLRRKWGYLDQFRWSILNEDRRQAKAVWGPKCH